MRDLPYYVPSKPQLCTDKGLTEPCYYLLIDSCTFNISSRSSTYVMWHQPNFGGGGGGGGGPTQYPELITEIQNEGIVLFLNNFNGPITIISSKFLNLVTIMRKDCSIDSVDASSFQSNPYQTIFVDRLIKERMENCNTDSQMSGSILNIRNLKLGLTTKDCLFEDNVGFTGTALFLHQFDIYSGVDSKSSVILIENNQFHRNMGLRYGLNIVIVNYAKDYVEIAYEKKCAGIQMNSNNFQDNVGCTKTFGNVIISCFPTTVTNMEAPYQSYYNLNDQASKTTYNMAYQYGISSDPMFNSANDYWCHLR